MSGARQRPAFNYWICYGGGLIAGALSFVVFDGDFWAAVIAVAAWFVTYTFFAANKDDKKAAAAAAPAATEEDTSVSRQVRRARQRQASKHRADKDSE